MKNTIKQIISSLLCVCLLIGVFAVPSFAANVSYKGSYEYMNSVYYERLTSVKLTGDEVTDIINVAKSQVGYHEGSSNADLNGYNTNKGDFNNYCEYNYTYAPYKGKHNGGELWAWCATFVSWCKNVATGDREGAELFPDFNGCKTASDEFNGGNWKDYGTWHSGPKSNRSSSYIPVKGDIVFYKWDSNSNWHVGIVVEDSKTKNKIVTVEGNTGDSLGNRSCAVELKDRDTNEVIGYFTPNYNKGSRLGTVDIIEPVNLNNAWVSPDSPGLIDWNGYENASYYEYTIREQKYNHETGDYDVIDNWLCQNAETVNTFVDLARYDLAPNAAYKIWIGAFNSNREIIAENFVYLRMTESTNDTSSDEGNRTEFDESFTGGTVGGFTDPLPNEGFQVEAEKDSSSDTNPSNDGNRTEFDDSYFDGLTGGTVDPIPDSGFENETGGNTGFDDSDIVDIRDNNSSEVLEPSEEDMESPDISEESSDETISLLKKIIAMLEVLFRFFGIAF